MSLQISVQMSVHISANNLYTRLPYVCSRACAHFCVHVCAHIYAHACKHAWPHVQLHFQPHVRPHTQPHVQPRVVFIPNSPARLRHLRRPDQIQGRLRDLHALSRHVEMRGPAKPDARLGSSLQQGHALAYTMGLSVEQIYVMLGAPCANSDGDPWACNSGLPAKAVDASEMLSTASAARDAT